MTLRCGFPRQPGPTARDIFWPFFLRNFADLAQECIQAVVNLRLDSIAVLP